MIFKYFNNWLSVGPFQRRPLEGCRCLSPGAGCEKVQKVPGEKRGGFADWGWGGDRLYLSTAVQIFEYSDNRGGTGTHRLRLSPEYHPYLTAVQPAADYQTVSSGVREVGFLRLPVSLMPGTETAEWR